MRVSYDTSIEAGVFLRNNMDGCVQISDNTIKNNNLQVGIGYPSTRSTNSCDGIELNICRGIKHTGTNAFTDGVASVCDGVGQKTLTALITGNHIENLQGGADGIDTNEGDNGGLLLTVTGNNVTGVGDEGFTLDTFGENTKAELLIQDNTFKSSGAKGSTAGASGSCDGISINLNEYAKKENEAEFTASGMYKIDILDNNIHVDTENLAGGTCPTPPADPPCFGEGKPYKSEGIRFQVGENVESGKIELEANISDNKIITRSGDGVEFTVLEKAKNDTHFKGDITIQGNHITQTNDALKYGKHDIAGVRSTINLDFIKKAKTTTSYNTSVLIDNNKLTTEYGYGHVDSARINFKDGSSESISTAQFKIKDNTVNVPTADSLSLGNNELQIVALIGTTDFNNYLKKTNNFEGPIVPATINATQIPSLTEFVTYKPILPKCSLGCNV